MQLAVAHNNMDFDSLAAQFAVTKLHPSARMALGYPIVGNIRSFLTLYRSNLPIVQLKYVELDNVSHLYIVDNQQIDRLDQSLQKLIKDGIPYTIFDHHDRDETGLAPGAQKDSIISRVGAATTLLVEQLVEQKLELTRFEATLLAIGIYEDSGCLTYQGTTSRDADCVAFLMKQGADLNVVNEYIRPKLSDKQLDLFQTLIQNSEVLQISGKRVVLAQASLPDYLDGLATLTRKLIEVESADAAFSVVKMRDRVHLVGRSDSPSVNVKVVVKEFAGDGHPGAGSAAIKEGNTRQIAAQVQSMLEENISRELTAREMMVTPVRTIHSDMSMDEAGKLMIRYGVDGLIVTKDNSVIGVISRRDVDQAIHHKLSHAPVAGFMSYPVVSIEPDTPLSTVQDLLVRNDIGRLPVLDLSGRILGLVSRHDVLRHSFAGRDSGEFILGPFGAKMSASEGMPYLSHQARTMDLSDKLEKLDEESLWLCRTIGQEAQQNKMVAYAVGGSVRDLILGLKSFDFDFVIEGSAIELAAQLANKYPDKFSLVASHERFQTATVTLHSELDRSVDLSTARIEFYEFPAALPTVEPSVLENDLFRRDFTINALAACVNPESFGVLYDYFDGLQDLRDGVIRVLHQFSFIEDPTRIMRAARFASRLGFAIDPKTEEQAKRAISIGKFDNLGGVRIRDELKLILQSPERLKGLAILSKLGSKLRYLDENLEYGEPQRKTIKRAEQLLSRYQLNNAWIIYLALLLARLSIDRLPEVLARLHLSNDDRTAILRGLDIYASLGNQPKELKKSELYELLHDSPDESLAIAACLAPAGSHVRRMTKLYFEQLKTVCIEVSGKDLLNIGFSEGPRIGEVLKAVLDAKLNGLVSTKKEELEFVKNLALSERSPAPPSMPH
jgi:tRNA nucleotidyltransferase (CCA-adding enzyme)